MNGDPIAYVIAILGGGSGLGTLIVTLVKTWGSSSGNAAALKLELNSQIDERVAEQVKDMRDEIRDLKQQVKDLQDSETKTKRENSQIKVAVKRFFKDLVAWNRMGRKGTMPLPSQADLDLLDLDPNEDTLTQAEIDELIVAHTPQ